MRGIGFSGFGLLRVSAFRASGPRRVQRPTALGPFEGSGVWGLGVGSFRGLGFGSLGVWGFRVLRVWGSGFKFKVWV